MSQVKIKRFFRSVDITLHAMWDAADKAVLLSSVEVIPWADAVALLTPPSE